MTIHAIATCYCQGKTFVPTPGVGTNVYAANAEDQRLQSVLSGTALGDETVREVITQIVQSTGSRVFALNLHEAVF